MVRSRGHNTWLYTFFVPLVTTPFPNLACPCRGTRCARMEMSPRTSWDRLPDSSLPVYSSFFAWTYIGMACRNLVSLGWTQSFLDPWTSWKYVQIFVRFQWCNALFFQPKYAIIYFISLRKHTLGFGILCKLSHYFLGNIRKNLINLSSAKIAQRGAKVKHWNKLHLFV